MDVSVIIPVYNSEKTLNRLIDCLENQSGCENIEYEIILVNDGSKDNSLELCQEFERNYDNIKVFTQENKGPSAARNVGIKNAVGSMIMFCDADDFIEQDSISYLFSRFNENDLLIFGLYDEYYNGEQLDSCKKWSVEEKQFFTNNEFLQDFHSILTNNMLYSQCTKAYKKALLDEHAILFNEELTMGEDVSFNLEYFKYVTQAKILPKCIYHYVHLLESDSISSVYFEGYFENVTSVYYKEIELLQSKNVLTTQNQKAIDNFFVGRISSAIQNELSNPFLKNSKQKMSAIKKIIDSQVASLVLSNSQSEKRLYIILENLMRKKQVWLILLLFNSLKYIKTSDSKLIKIIKNKLS